MIVTFHEARASAAMTSTRRLRRLERRARRDSGSLGSAGMTRWAAIRAELSSRGKTLRAPEQRPEHWWQR